MAYLLMNKVGNMLGHDSTAAAELAEFSAPYLDQYGKIVKQLAPLADLLTSVWSLASEETKIVGEKFWVGAAAALGVFMDDPRTELEAMRPRLAVWYHDEIRQIRPE